MAEHADHTVARLLALTPPEQARLARILARLASPYAGERAAAGLLVSAFVAKHDLTWGDLTTLLRPLPKAPVAPDGPPPTHDRRRSNSRNWHRYSRRRLILPGQVLNRIA